MKRRDFVSLATVSAASLSMASRTASASRLPRQPVRDDAVLMYWPASEELDDLQASLFDVPAHEWAPAKRLLIGDGQFRALDARVCVVGLLGTADETLSLDVVFPVRELAVRPIFHAWQFDPRGLASGSSIEFELPMDHQGTAQFVLTRGGSETPTSISTIRFTTGAMTRLARLRRGIYAIGFGHNPTHNHVVLAIDYARPSGEQGV